MSLETIQIYRDFPIINGYVQLQPNRESDKTRYSVDSVLAAVTDSEQKQLPHPSTNPTTGSNFGAQAFVRVPGQTFSLPSD